MNDNLKHAGVKGMQWGVRKKRDMPGESGGKQPKAKSDEPVRLKKNMPGETGGKKPRKVSGDAKEVASYKKMHPSELSNEQLQKYARRMDLEKKFKDLNPSRAAKGKKKIEAVFATAGKAAGVAGSVGALVVTGKKLYDFAKANKTALKRIPGDFSI